MFGYVSPKGAAGLRASTAQKRRLLSTICRSSLNPGLCHNLPKRVRALSEAIGYERERVANEHQQKRAPNVLAAYQPSDRPAHCDCLPISTRHANVARRCAGMACALPLPAFLASPCRRLVISHASLPSHPKDWQKTYVQVTALQ